ncbi:Zn-dependent peptidase ImmA, M78 family [Gordonia malaquae]|uniref:Transcriptional regulator n=2 Tax=Gordonia TaxID=2053 RepID=A0A7I9V686_9ACTN|nr:MULTISPECIES: ImmA/IrrE family metallo-endopeptidase [Gordonia]GAC81528.1 putative Xre family DNA-binding protein [Gordonia malaquae NBRC 108250]GEE00590.1 transcriptional regulator [Gordonia spumicola]SEB48697.1 Zn-dependent peptidase ImmA, M78 family [Gordonia malaquae]
MFNPSRLRLARLRLGYTLTELAKVSGVSSRALTDFENGHRPPAEDTLIKLADALAVPAAFLERESIEPVATGAASFRKLSKTSAIRRDAVLAKASLALEFFDTIEERFRLPDADIPTFDKLAPEHAAGLVRHRWSLGDRPISNMVHLLEAKGVRVASLSHSYDDIDAFCFYRDGSPYVFLNTEKTGERQRFDAAHELGHLVLHSELEMDPSTSKEREAEANAFASSFLMPKTAVESQQMRAANIERVLAARSYWKVSAMAMTHRLHELHLLTDWQYRSACITLSERGFRRSEPGGIVPETSQLLRKVMFGEGARITAREAARILDLSPAEVREYVRHLVPVSA